MADYLHWRDGIVGCRTLDGQSIITSPNMSFIPEPLYDVGAVITVSRMPDGHFGSVDPLHWLQMLPSDTSLSWMAAIRRAPFSREHPYICMWHVLKPEDFETQIDHRGIVTEITRGPLLRNVRDIMRSVEQFKSENGFNEELEWLASTMQNAMDRLIHPSTYRDIVCQHACVQRFYLYATAWLDWHVAIFKLYSCKTWRPLPPRTKT